MKRITVFSLLAFSTIIGFSQIKMIDLNGVFTNPKMQPSNLSQLQWKSNTEYTWVANNCIIGSSVKSPKIDTLVRISDINIKLSNLKIEELKTLPQVKWKNENTIYFTHSRRLFYYELKKKNLLQITEYYDKSSNYNIDYQLKKIAYTRTDNNIFVSDNGRNFQVTFDGGNGIVNGESVHRNEWGIKKGTFWSPNGNYLAFYRMDESMVTQYPLIDISGKNAKVENIRYPMAGAKSHEVTIGIYNNETGKTIFLQTGEPKEKFLTNITWSSDELSIFVAILNRQQNEMKLVQYDVLTGMYVKTLYEENNVRYVEPSHGMYFMNTNSNKFLWMSQRDGWNHLYQFDLFGKLEKQLTKGHWVVKDFLGFDSKDEFAYFTANIDNPIETHTYSVDMKTGVINCISKDAGTHSANFSEDYKYFIDKFSSTKTANTIKITNNKGLTAKTILESEDPLKDYTLGETSIFTIKNKKNQDLYCRMIKPVNFDPNKKYPCLIYVYGGPHSQLVTNSWLAGGGHFLNYMAQKGYVIFTLDNRGTANRGFEFESCIHRNLGALEMEDQLEGVKYLKNQLFIDTTRIGIDGWSYGGFMTLTMILKNPNMFKAATCGGPVVDWKWYEVMYGERYMDRPDENIDGYENTSLLQYVDSLQIPLLIFQGGQDETVLYQNSLSFIEKSIKSGKLVDYFIYPNHEHNVRGVDRVHLWRKIEQFHDLHLKN